MDRLANWVETFPKYFPNEPFPLVLTRQIVIWCRRAVRKDTTDKDFAAKWTRSSTFSSARPRSKFRSIIHVTSFRFESWKRPLKKKMWMSKLRSEKKKLVLLTLYSSVPYEKPETIFCNINQFREREKNHFQFNMSTFSRKRKIRLSHQRKSVQFCI